MTHKEIAQLVKSIGLPCTYHHWEKNDVPALPYIVFYESSRTDFFADDTNYLKIMHLVLELYADNKDLASESKVETVLEQNSIPYTKEETYISSEQMYEVIYEMEVALDA